jgi:hypothetical protein
MVIFEWSLFTALRPRRNTMRNRSALFFFALLGVLGTGRMADAQPGGPSSDGLPVSEKGIPPIDAALPARLSTATFALG